MADDALQQFMHELLLRFEKRTDAIVRRLDAGTAQLRANTEQVRANTEETRQNTREMGELMRDMRAEIRAQTEAIYHVLDELRGGGPATA